MRALLLATLFATMLVTLLSGCERETALSDLHQLVAETETAPSSQRMSPPPRAAEQNIQYDAQNERSPFQNALPSTPVAGPVHPSVQAISRPAADHDRSTLATLALDELTLVGTLSGLQQASVQALFRDAAGHIHRLSVGDAVGPNAARIVAVSETRVELLEQVPVEDGGWILQPRTFLLSQQKPSRP